MTRREAYDAGFTAGPRRSSAISETIHQHPKMIMLLLLRLILPVLIAILIRLCVKDRKPLVTSADYHNAGVARVVWGILLVILGFVFPVLAHRVLRACFRLCLFQESQKTKRRSQRLCEPSPSHKW